MSGAEVQGARPTNELTSPLVDVILQEQAAGWLLIPFRVVALVYEVQAVETIPKSYDVTKLPLANVP